MSTTTSTTQPEPGESTARRHGRGALALALTIPFVVSSVSIAMPASAAEPIAAATLTEVSVPGTSIMNAAGIDLAAYGYTEKEYYVSGTASRFANTDSTSLKTAELVDSGHPYTTRVIVRAPEPAKFNGMLAVEWSNVTVGTDGEFSFAESYNELLRSGYAVAAVSAQRVGVEAAKKWEPARYGSLSVDVNSCGGAGASLCSGDPLSFDIFTQVAKALKSGSEHEKALPGLDVKKVVATGQSQSAIRLTSYYNTIQPHFEFFDGFVYWDRSTQLRNDVGAKAISVNSNSLANIYAPVTTSTNTRTWDVAGSSHGSYRGSLYMDSVYKRDRAVKNSAGEAISFTDWVAPSCTVQPPFSSVSSGLVVQAALRSMTAWLEEGTPAPADIVFARDGDGKAALDDRGRTLGGVQLSSYAVPTDTIDAFNGDSFPCSYSGSHVEKSTQELEQDYVSHARYVSAVKSVMQTAVNGGYVLEEDARAEVALAEASDVAKTQVSLTAETTAPEPGHSSVTARVTPRLESGAWLEQDGKPVPVVLTGTATFSADDTPVARTRGLAATAKTYTLTVDGPEAKAEVEVDLPNTNGSLALTWCVDADNQPEPISDHIDETCSEPTVIDVSAKAAVASPSPSEPASTPSASASEPSAPATSNSPAPSSVDPEPTENTVGAAPVDLAQTGSNSVGLLAIGGLLACAGIGLATVAMARRRRGQRH